MFLIRTETVLVHFKTSITVINNDDNMLQDFVIVHDGRGFNRDVDGPF